ncbi:MAG TPA: hypothetical protein VFE47_29200 [Tepidisphaeraceae bacterium]|jgi:hypothetical protein|nr:hypothetical protein [Tepidisphaeraceae bacterium]
MKNAVMICAVVALGFAGGCAGRPSLLPNTDPNLRETSAQLAADAAKRQYHADAPRGGDALASAEYDLTFQKIEILNYGEEDWHNVEVWVNKKYVVFIPELRKDKQRVETIDFPYLFDDAGNCFSTNGGKTPIASIEIYRDGKMYTINDPKLAD